MVRVAGWREPARLPGLELDLVAKLDTGALSSALHVTWIEPVTGADGPWMRFGVALDRDGEDERQAARPLLGWKWVRDSGGHGTLRPVVSLDVEVAGEQWTEACTLADRSDMQHRLLLGRRALRGRFIIDPEGEWLLAPPPGLATAQQG